MQIVFGRDAILNIKHVTDWEHIWQQKQEVTNCNKKRKNMRLTNHQQKNRDKIPVKLQKNSKHELEFMVSFLVT